jgi:hypothetical protein
VGNELVVRLAPGDEFLGVPYSDLAARVGGGTFELADPALRSQGEAAPAPAAPPLDAVEAMRRHLRSRGIEPRAEPEVEARPGEPAMVTAMRRLIASR